MQYVTDEPENTLSSPVIVLPLLSRKARETCKTMLLVVSLYCLVNLATARFVVEGASMSPNFYTDQFIIVNRLAYMFGTPARGDVVVFHNPEDPSHDFIKRLIGLPGETVRINGGRISIDGKPVEEPYVAALCQDKRCDGQWTLDANHYFVLGDNRSHSHDSHSFGPLDQSLIIGLAWIRYWPPEDWGVITHYNYGLAAH